MVDLESAGKRLSVFKTVGFATDISISNETVLIAASQPSCGPAVSGAFVNGVEVRQTIEDALEEIVGELVDEHDAAEPVVKPLEDGAFLVPARLPLDELGELFGMEIDDDDVETAAGLLTKALGTVPIEGARATSHGLILTADRTAGRRRALAWIVAARDPEVTDE